MESAAFFARPIPVRAAERVSIPARKTEERAESRKREMSVSVSCAVRRGKSRETIGRAKTMSPAAQGAESRTVTSRAYRARAVPSPCSPSAKLRETAGTIAATSP